MNIIIKSGLYKVILAVLVGVVLFLKGAIIFTIAIGACLLIDGVMNLWMGYTKQGKAIADKMKKLKEDLEKDLES